MKSETKEKTAKITWEAQEYVQHEKNAVWYVWLAAVTLGLVALSIYLQLWTFMCLVMLSAVVLVLHVVKPPRTLRYSLSDQGLFEGERLYDFADYKAFGVLQEEGNFAIILIPVKRFAASVVVYFPKDKGEEIVDGFGARLPMKEVKRDILDKIVNLLRI